MTQAYRKMVSIVPCFVEPLILMTSTEPMKDASENEQEDDFISKPTENPDPKKSKAQRAEQLRKMMEDEGNNAVATLTSIISADITQDEETETDPEDPHPPSQDSIPIDALPSHSEPSPEPPVVVSGGRRRGRRKVMKKKTIKDEEGYLGPLELITS